MTFNIRTRITVAIGVGVGLLVALISTAFYQHVQIARNMQIIETVAGEIELTSHLQLTIAMALMPPNDYLITGQIDEREEFKRLTGEIEKLLERIEGLKTLNRKERAHLNRLREGYERLKAMAEKIFALSDPVGHIHVTSLMKQFDATGNDLILHVGQFHLIYERKLEQARQEAARTRQQAFRYLTGSAAVLGILALAFGLRLAGSIIRPIRMLESGTERIAAGNWDHRVDIRTGDELEMLAQRFNGMAERLGNLYHSLESEVTERTRHITEQMEDLATLLETSTELSTTLEMDQLLSLIAERMTHALKATYCRIALIDADHPEPVIRAAYPIRMLDWEPGIGRVLETQALPDLRTVFATLRYVILSHEAIGNPERAIEQEQLLTPETQSALIVPLILKGHPEGVAILGEAREWKREPFSSDKIALGQTMANHAVIAIANVRNHADLQEMSLAAVTAMASAIDAKSPWTRGHSDRVTRHAMAIGEQLRLDSPTLTHLRLGCILHDIGKIGTYEAILDKPGRLTDKEMALMKQHPVKGEEILKPIRQFKPILPVIRHHHERYDGKGYPDGLEGEDIPLLARIAAIADAYDAMTADRPYREAFSRRKALAEIKRCAGTQFDPTIAPVFVKLLESGYQ